MTKGRILAGSALAALVLLVSFVGASLSSNDTPGSSGEVVDTRPLDDENNGSDDGLSLSEELAEIARTEGPQAAIERYRAEVEIDPYVVSVCHGVFEVIGRAATKAAGGIPEFFNTECQFGYVHGVLYSLAGEYKSIDELMEATVEYCARFSDNNQINGPNSSCNHGIGHLAATIAEDPMEAIVSCRAAIGTSGSDACVDGVLMEYGEDNLVRYGWMEPGHDNTDIETSFDNQSITKLCKNVPEYAVVKCYSRIWMFIGPDTGPEYTAGTKICAEAPTAEAYTRCHVGFGELVSLKDIVDGRIPWPPSTEEEVDRTARIMAERCNGFPEPGHCVNGAIASNISHLYSVADDVSMIPNPCKYISRKHLAACESAMEDGRNLNWDLVNEPENDLGSKK